MNSDRIKKLQEQTAFPDSVSVRQALLQVWNECQQENNIELAALRKENEELKSKGRFEIPTDKQMIDLAILFNDGILDEEKLSDMVAYGQFIVDNYLKTAAYPNLHQKSNKSQNLLKL